MSSSARLLACPFLVLAALTAALGLGAGCTEEVGTSIRVSLVYKDGWRMQSAEVIVAQADNTKLESRASISHELLVLVPDRLAGNVMPLEVWGVRADERIAHGSAVALVRKGETVEATIVLDRLPCGVFCEPGEVECEQGGVATCEEDADGCLQWSEPVACPSEQPFCSGGVCGTVCSDDCVAGQGTCVDANTARACGEFDNDTCRDYGPAIPCASMEVCYSGRCALPCQLVNNLSNSNVPGATGAFTPAIIADAASTLHAVYSAANTRVLRYASKPVGGNWSAWADIQDGSGTLAVGENPSLTVDKRGGLHLVAGGTAVSYASRAAGAPAWTISTVSPDADAGSSTSVAVTDDGVAHVVYYASGTTKLMHAARNGNGWDIEEAGAALGQRCDLAVTGNTLHVGSFDATNNVWYSTKVPGQDWMSSKIKTAFEPALVATAGVSIVAGRDGTLHLAYSDMYPGDNDLRYLYRPAGGSWTTTTVVIDDANNAGTTGATPDLAIDPFDRLHVVYRTTPASGNLRYATKDSGTTVWSLSPQPPGAPGVAPAIAIDPGGGVHILSANIPAAGLIETSRACQ